MTTSKLAVLPNALLDFTELLAPPPEFPDPCPDPRAHLLIAGVLVLVTAAARYESAHGIVRKIQPVDQIAGRVPGIVASDGL